jgi:parallel beta-helix repeat protein
MKIVSIATSLFIVSISSVNAASLFVNTGGTGLSCSQTEPCGSIQSAVNIAGPKDVIHVSDGTFKENVDIRGAEKAGLKIKGSGNTIVESAGGLPGACGPCPNVAADIIFDLRTAGVSISDLTISHPASTSMKRELGVFARPPAANASINNVNFHRTRSDEPAQPGSRGVFVFLAPGFEVKHSTFTGNYEDAVHIPSSSSDISHNTIIDAPRVGIVIIQEPGGSPAEDNIIKGNTVSGSGNDGIQIQGDNNIVKDNTIENSVGAGIKLCGEISGDCVMPGDGTSGELAIASENIVKGNTLIGNGENNEVIDNGMDNIVK